MVIRWAITTTATRHKLCKSTVGMCICVFVCKRVLGNWLPPFPSSSPSPLKTLLHVIPDNVVNNWRIEAANSGG